jgi:hypothetical protein
MPPGGLTPLCCNWQVVWPKTPKRNSGTPKSQHTWGFTPSPFPPLNARRRKNSLATNGDEFGANAETGVAHPRLLQ